ncbi:hypothetical protein [Kitasatospora sp. SUK 42]|uniref:hypothetical protein n=1 Tax=Kitasatospora sp. SUK 42 TaxID=1588882 RepID=UPI0018C97ACC|nr:hypothetical protein [Kitasatospora sp. SUK 42]MBV2155816.1 hypothetical protein [Kitasatospora sp. SUK 42]
MSRMNSALATACCALLLAAPIALAQPAAADDGNITTPEQAAACRSVVGALLGGFGSLLANTACVPQAPSKG